MQPNIIDRVIAGITSPFSRKEKGRTRSFDAAGGGRRWEKAGSLTNLNAAVMAASTISARRAAYYARNNPWVVSAVASMVGSVVGTGIKPRSQHPNPAVRERLHKLWDGWQRRADVSGVGDFYALQALAVRAMMEGGEAFIRLRPRLPSDGFDVPFQVELIDREMVPLDRFSDTGNRVRAGIEFDGAGRRVAFHVLPVRPGDPFAPIGATPLDTVRVSASEMLHLFAPLEAGQIRGITWLAPILLRLHELDQFEDAALVKAKVGALFAGFITDPSGDNAGAGPAGSDGAAALSLEPGTLVPLPPGADIRFSQPQTDTAYSDFVRSCLRAIAAGLGCTYEQLTGDYSATNYSSARAALVEHRRRIEQLQHGVIVPQLCRPVWERFVRVAVLSGALPAPDFAADPEAYFAVEWLPPAFEWVDPQKDVRAEIEAVNAGFKSRSQVLAERGYDAERVDAEIAADRDREQRLGLSFTVPSAEVPPQIPENP